MWYGTVPSSSTEKCNPAFDILLQVAIDNIYSKKNYTNLNAPWNDEQSEILQPIFY